MGAVTGPNLSHMLRFKCSGPCRMEVIQGFCCHGSECEYNDNFEKELKNGRVAVDSNGKIVPRQPLSY